VEDIRTALKLSLVARATWFDVRHWKTAQKPIKAAQKISLRRAAVALTEALAAMRPYILKYPRDFFVNFEEILARMLLIQREDYFGIHKSRYAFVRRVAEDSSEIARHVARKGRLWCLLLTLTILSGCMFKGAVPQQQYDRAMQLVDEGTIKLRQGKLDHALAAFTMAYEIAPVAAAVDGQGCVALLQGRYNEAEDLFDRAYDMDPGYENALGNMALLMEITGRSAAAKDYYNQAVATFPEHPGFRNNRAVLEYDRGERKMLVVQELKKADLVAEHGVVDANLELLERGSLGLVGESLVTTTAKMGEAESWQRN